jgi:hypothetical protein
MQVAAAWSAARRDRGACGSCAEAYGEAQGLRCAGGHFTCAECLSNQVEMMQGATTPAELKATSGGLRCLAIVEGAPRGRFAPCRALVAQEAVLPLLRPEAVVALLRATTHAYLSTVQREERAVAKAATAKDRVAALCGAWAAAPGGVKARADAVAALAAHVADEAVAEPSAMLAQAVLDASIPAPAAGAGTGAGATNADTEPGTGTGAGVGGEAAFPIELLELEHQLFHHWHHWRQALGLVPECRKRPDASSGASKTAVAQMSGARTASEHTDRPRCLQNSWCFQCRPRRPSRTAGGPI